MSECVLKALACRGLRVGPSKVEPIDGETYYPSSAWSTRFVYTEDCPRPCTQTTHASVFGPQLWEELSMDHCQSRGKLLTNSQGHWSIQIFPETNGLVHTDFRRMPRNAPHFSSMYKSRGTSERKKGCIQMWDPKENGDTDRHRQNEERRPRK